MFTLISGLPGSGKSLHTIRLVEKERVLPDGSKRLVFYWGIPDLKLDWTPLCAPDSTPEDARARYDKGLTESRPEDAHHWFNVPPGSIVVLDEAQYIFPKLTQKQASAPAEHYKQLAIHRHTGTDLYAMTQHPSLLAVEARRQVQRHWHLERPFGLDYTNRLAWERCMSPDDRAARAQASVERLPLDKSVFGLYRSAEVHTVKKRLPWKKLSLAIGSLAVVVGLFVFAFSMLTGNKDTAESVAGPASLEQPSSDDAWGGDALRPRIPTWPWSAPFYDAVTKIASAPRLTGCMRMAIGEADTCVCHDGQGIAQVSARVCKDFIAGRYFDPTRPAVYSKAENVRYLESKGSGEPSGDAGESGGARVVAPSKS